MFHDLSAEIRNIDKLSLQRKKSIKTSSTRLLKHHKANVGNWINEKTLKSLSKSLNWWMLPWFGLNLHKKSVLKQQSWCRRQWCDDFLEENFVLLGFNHAQALIGSSNEFTLGGKASFGRKPLPINFWTTIFTFLVKKVWVGKVSQLTVFYGGKKLFHRRVEINDYEIFEMSCTINLSI